MMLHSVLEPGMCPKLSGGRAVCKSGRCFPLADGKLEELAGDCRKQQECWLPQGVLAGIGVSATAKPEEWQHS